MSRLEKFSDLEVDLLVALPYRAGLWVSRADQTGGNEAQVEEARTLKEIISQQAETPFESDFVHEIMAEIMARKELWPDWGKDLENVPDECKRASLLLRERLSRNDEDAYKQNIMFIATEIAKAFREFDKNVGIWARLFTGMKIQIDKLIGLVTGRRYESEVLLNISYEEDVILSRIASALRSGVDDKAEDMKLTAQK